MYNYTFSPLHLEGPLPLYISYIGPEQTKQGGDQETLEAAGDKCQ